MTRPAWPTKDRPWITRRRGLNLPACWEAWALLVVVLVGAVPLLLPFPWRLASVLPVGVGGILLIIGAAKQHVAERQ